MQLFTRYVIGAVCVALGVAGSAVGQNCGPFGCGSHAQPLYGGFHSSPYAANYGNPPSYTGPYWTCYSNRYGHTNSYYHHVGQYYPYYSFQYRPSPASAYRRHFPYAYTPPAPPVGGELTVPGYFSEGSNGR